MNDFPHRLMLLLSPLALSACNPSAPTTATSAEAAAAPTPPLAGARIGGPFTLTNQDGKRVSDTDFAGQYRIMYFGYTYCPDVCPVDVQHIGAAMKLLDKSDPALAARITPIFVSVDPARDTPPVLKQFVSAFHPRMVGLTGSPDEIAAVAGEFAIFYQPQAPDASGGYVVNHSRQAYLFGPNGQPIALLTQDDTPEKIAAEIKRWAR